MGGIKHKMDEVAARLGIQDPNDPRVKAEVEKELKREMAVAQRAEELARLRFGCSFNELSPREQEWVWLDAEKVA